MPGRARRAQKTPLTLGFAGSGELDKKALDALLDDLVTEDTQVDALYVPVTKDDFTDEVENVVKWAVDSNIPYITISDDDAHKDRALKKVIDAAAEDFAPEGDDTIGKTIVDLLLGDEENPVADGRLLIFLDQEQDVDTELVELADSEDVPMFDLCNGLEVITLEGDTSADTEAADTAPEPEPEESGPMPRRRGRAAAAAEPAAEDVETFTREELIGLPLTELKKKAKAQSKDNTTESMRGMSKDDVIAILTATGAEGTEESGDEAQASLQAVPDAAGEDSEAESREAVFSRLQGQREASERIAKQVVRATAALIDGAEEGEEFETAAAIVAGALMIFADFIVTEVRKPKSPGRPRKDGTEAQPKPAAVEAPKTRRRRAS